jgi:hypothetical protein
MARLPTLSFDRGTLLLHPPPPGNAWIDAATWDDRVERFRLPAWQYCRLVTALQMARNSVSTSSVVQSRCSPSVRLRSRAWRCQRSLGLKSATQ